MKLRLLVTAVVLLVLGAGAWGTRRFIRLSAPRSLASELPVTRVKRGRVVIAVTARGELQGGNSEMLVAPMTGVDSMPITFLRRPGELVKAGDDVVQFDTTQQEFNLREAQADFAEAQQQVIQADATAKATDEEDQYQVESTESDVKLAALEVRRNPILPTITARQNDLALEAARNRHGQALQDSTNKRTNALAAIAIQEAALNKAKVTVDTNQRIIDSMTLKAKTSGYVNIQPNTFTNMMYWGQAMLPFQLGDVVRPGAAVAQIPDFNSWELNANVGELDRGHLAQGQKVAFTVVALPGKSFSGRVKTIGGTTGSGWDRHFECRITVEQPVPELRPGMTCNLVITTETLDNVIWLPSQALFDSDGRAFVYLIKEGDLVAMSNPDQQNKADSGRSSAMKALPQ
jgi:HlyD family secretion protein